MKKQAKEFGLTGKLYTLTVLVAMSIHTVGIWILTPATNPPLIKNIFMSGFLLFLLIAIGYFSFKPVNEQPDERFYMNLAKSASIMFIVTILLLLILTGFIFFESLTLIHPGLILVGISIILLFFAFLYHTFESLG